MLCSSGKKTTAGGPVSQGPVGMKLGVIHHLEKNVVGGRGSAALIRLNDHHNVEIKQAAKPCFVFAQCLF